MDELQRALVCYGIQLLAQSLHIPGENWPGAITRYTNSAFDPHVQERINRACKILNFCATPFSGSRLSSIFNIVRDPFRNKPAPCTLPLKRLEVDLRHSEDEDPRLLWEDFCTELTFLPTGKGAGETFLALLRKYGTYLRGTTYHPEISVYEQYKIVSALSYCLSDEDENVLMVKGDLPGIQRIIYTITSRGAAKAVKGRSFYIQLLNDAIVRLILRKLKLPPACVVYNAGGNFLLLARTADEEDLASLAREINCRLLFLHRGEIMITLAWEPIRAAYLVNNQECRRAMETLGEKMQLAKRRPWADLAVQKYAHIFGLQGEGREDKGAQYKGICSICHDEVAESDLVSKDDQETCRQCKSYEDLADMIAGTDMFFLSSEEDRENNGEDDCRQPEQKSSAEVPGARGNAYLAVRESVQAKDYLASIRKPAWQECLLALESKYELLPGFPPAGSWDAGSWDALYRLNSTDFLPRRTLPDTAYGFRFLPNLTPRVTREDEEFLRRHANEEEFTGLKTGNIRDTSLMAKKDATGIPWYGVLRMDIDDLGAVLSSPERLDNHDIPHTSALSAAPDLFFQGWLNILCADSGRAYRACLQKNIPQDIGLKTPYLIYSGGDDLFIVGPWDILPRVARDIQDDFRAYVLSGHVNGKASSDVVAPLTISAGLFCSGHKFPLYQAADLAHQALEKAKGRRIPVAEGKFERVKNAVHWMGFTLSWDDFQQAEKMAFNLVRLVTGAGGRRGAARSLLWFLYAIAGAYKKAEKEACRSAFPEGGQKAPKGGGVVYGRWMWLLAYGRKRFCQQLEQVNPGLAGEVMQITDNLLDVNRPVTPGQQKTIQFLGFAVRWAELLLRKGERSAASE